MGSFILKFIILSLMSQVKNPRTLGSLIFITILGRYHKAATNPNVKIKLSIDVSYVISIASTLINTLKCSLRNKSLKDITIFASWDNIEPDPWEIIFLICKPQDIFHAHGHIQSNLASVLTMGQVKKSSWWENVKLKAHIFQR